MRRRLLTRIHFVLRKAAIDLFVWLFGQHRSMALTRALALHTPLAREHFDHYLVGGGHTRSVETAALLKGDDGVRSACCQLIRQAVAAGATAGEARIPQWQFRNRDWRYALGSVGMHWRREGSDIVLWFREPYRWYPAVRRMTQALHRAADHLRLDGAREFAIEGRPCTLSLAAVATAPLPRPVSPRHRLYL
jgi:hypothetical protein